MIVQAPVTRILGILGQCRFINHVATVATLNYAGQTSFSGEVAILAIDLVGTDFV